MRLSRCCSASRRKCVLVQIHRVLLGGSWGARAVLDHVSDLPLASTRLTNNAPTLYPTTRRGFSARFPQLNGSGPLCDSSTALIDDSVILRHILHRIENKM